jgi:hypothetical protein
VNGDGAHYERDGQDRRLAYLGGEVLAMADVDGFCETVRASLLARQSGDVLICCVQGVSMLYKRE